MRAASAVALALAMVLTSCDSGLSAMSGAVPTVEMATQQAALAGYAVKGTDDGPGVDAEGGSGGGHGVVGRGVSAGYGLVGFGGSSAWFGVYGVGGGTDGSGIAGAGVGAGVGVVGAGGAYGAGGHFRPGTPSTATSRRAAIIAQDGDIVFNVPAPTPNVPIINAVTPSNVAKAWAVISTNGPGTYNVSIFDGANIGPMSVAADSVEVRLAAPTGGQCAAIATGIDVPLLCRTSCSGGLVVVRCHKIMQNGTLATYNFGGESPTALSLVVFGTQ